MNSEDDFIRDCLFVAVHESCPFPVSIISYLHSGIKEIALNATWSDAAH